MIILSYTLSYPDTMMIEFLNTFVTVSAMFRSQRSDDQAGGTKRPSEIISFCHRYYLLTLFLKSLLLLLRLETFPNTLTILMINLICV